MDKTSIDNPAIFFEEEDIPFEEDILRNPFSVKCWLRYIEHKKNSPNKLNLIYERALKELPGSYKLWYNYLKLRQKQVHGHLLTDPCFEEANNAFERSLAWMHKMPRIWLDYCQFLMSQGLVTLTRRMFDRALRALPVTQHHRIWKPYLEFVRLHRDLPETAVRVYRRYLMLMPEDAEEFISYLVSIDRLDEATVRLAGIINNEKFVSKEGKSKHQLWNELCELISKNPDKIKSLKVEPIIRQGIKRYPDQTGQLWNSLAGFYTRSGQFEKARDIYEEAIQTVVTVRDFSQVFEAYSDFEEKLVQCFYKEGEMTDEDDLKFDFHITRYEHLMDRQALLLNSVLLRQNPHSVTEWLNRVALFEGKPREVINTFIEAVQSIDPKLAIGKLWTLWVAFAKFYENADQLEDTRIVFEKATNVNFKHVDDLAYVWCEWAEMEIRHNCFDEAMKLIRRAVTPPKRKVDYHDNTETVQMRVYKSLKVWSVYADLEESYGTFQSCKSVYDRIIDLGIATPQIVLNYAAFLEDHNYFEEAFKAYEKGVHLFKWPNVFDVWNTYLVKFVERYSGKKLERIRDLFEHCLKGCPPDFAKPIYLMYAKHEEEHGLPRAAMDIYKRATKAIRPDEAHEMYNIYIKRAAELFGITYTRDIYQEAIESLQDDHARQMCISFAEMERMLGEIDRARGIYVYCSQICDPRVTKIFWDTWLEFERKHGNEDTMREMMRIKRSVQALFNTQVNFMSAQMLSAQAAKQAHQDQLEEKDEMKKLEERARELAAEAENDVVKSSRAVSFVRSQNTDEELKDLTRTNNPEEINIGEDDDEDETVEEVTIEKRQVPVGVFHGLVGDEDD